jgi:hypothetical protein
LAFIPLTQSVFWGPLAYTLIGGTAGGTVLILVFLPALYSIWFRVKLSGDPGSLRTAAQHNQVNVGVYAAVERGGTISRGDPVRIE